MTLWRLEWLRLVRTGRVVALVAVYLFFGLTSPPLMRYRDQFIDALGGGSSGVTITGPPVTPADGVITFASNAAQIGLLVFALVAASALAFDANRESAIFLRTRVRRPRDLVLVKYAVNVAAGCAAFDVGALAAWFGSWALLGPLPAGGMLAGIVLADLYLAFVAALVALFASRISSVALPAIGALAVAIGLGILGLNRTVAHWLPSNLVGALAGLASGQELSGYLASAAVTLAVTAGLLALAAQGSEQREL